MAPPPPSFAPHPSPHSLRATPLSTPAMRLAARARLASTSLDPPTTRLRKRRKSDIPDQPVVAQTPKPLPAPVVLQVSDRVLAAEKIMSQKLASLKFTGPVHTVYDPLTYAWDAHEWYVNQYGNSRKEILLVGMNPGPWGMAQTGVPFGEITAVKEWMAMPDTISITKPIKEHPKRPVKGLQSTRSEVSGRRLWLEWARETPGGEDAKHFFNRYYVHNYCPLMFMEESGRNRTPTQIRAYERNQVAGICDEGLRDVVKALRPRIVCGIGGFATERCRGALKEWVEKGLVIRTLLHPSPASPLANKGWAEKAKETMDKIVAELAESEDVWAPKTEN